MLLFRLAKELKQWERYGQSVELRFRSMPSRDACARDHRSKVVQFGLPKQYELFFDKNMIPQTDS